MALSLKPIDESNFEACIDLDVTDYQKQFVASNMYSLAECYAVKEADGFLMVDQDTFVGFTMISYETEGDFKGPWIVRFMVDQRFQRKGYGRQAMIHVLEKFKSLHPNETIYLSTKENNTTAILLYESFGFKATGKMLYGEMVFARFK